MDRIAVLPDIRPAGYPAILKTGYRISDRISGGCRIPDILPDTGYFRHMINDAKISLKILNHFSKTRASKLIKSKQRVNIFFIRFDLRGHKNMWIWCTLVSGVHMTLYKLIQGAHDKLTLSLLGGTIGGLSTSFYVIWPWKYKKEKCHFRGQKAILGQQFILTFLILIQKYTLSPIFAPLQGV